MSTEGYEPVPYPAHRFGPSGDFKVVTNKLEDDEAYAEGYRDHPSKVSQSAETPTEETTPVKRGRPRKSQ